MRLLPSFRFLPVIVVALLHVTAVAQNPLRGKVLAGDTRQPVIAASVFLNNTSIGAVTNDQGEFTIQKVPAGRFDLIISSFGYATAKVTINPGENNTVLEILLRPAAEELKEVIVEPYEKDGWETWGSIFLDNFIGTSLFAADCRIINKEALKFRFSKKRNMLRVSADERLVIENRALGYIIKYDLTRFEYDVSDRTFLYQGYPFFEEMRSDKKNTLTRWARNRQDAYDGSIMHFMRALFHRNLVNEKFEIRKIIVLSQEEKVRVQKNYDKLLSKDPAKSVTVITKNGSTVLKSDTAAMDTIAYYKQILASNVGSSVIIDLPMNVDSISFRQDRHTVGLFFTDPLNILYLPKKKLPEFQKYLPRYTTLVTSEVTAIPNKVISVFSDGSYFDGLDLIFSGFWAWSGKICNKLPYDYIPPGK